MAEQSKRESVNRTVAWVLAAVVSLPLIYVLSSGPAIIIHFKAPSLRAPIEDFYAPVVWLDRDTFLKKPLDMYSDFWVGLAKKI